MRGDVDVLRRIEKADRRKSKAGAKIAKRLQKDSKRAAESKRNGQRTLEDEFFKVSAVYPKHYAVQKSHGWIRPAQLLARLMKCRFRPPRGDSTGAPAAELRLAFRTVDVCGDTNNDDALLIAPTRPGVSFSQTETILKMICGPYRGQVPLFQSSLPIDRVAVPLFNNTAFQVNNQHVCHTVSLQRTDVMHPSGSFPIFSLHIGDAAGGPLVVEPDFFGLSRVEYQEIQRKGAKMLGVELMSQWALG